MSIRLGPRCRATLASLCSLTATKSAIRHRKLSYTSAGIQNKPNRRLLTAGGTQNVPPGMTMACTLIHSKPSQNEIVINPRVVVLVQTIQASTTEHMRKHTPITVRTFLFNKYKAYIRIWRITWGLWDHEATLESVLTLSYHRNY